MHKKLWNKDYILMLQGNAVSSIGDLIYSVAIGYWVFEQTGSNALMGIISSISMFMVMLVMPFSGTLIDKCNRKAVIVGMDVARGAIMLCVGGFAFAGRLSVGLVLLAAFLASGCSVFFSPAVSTLMLDIIPHDDMVRGQSMQNGIHTFISLVSKAFSGAVVAFLGVPLVIVINGISYLISALTELFITVPRTKRQGEAVTVRSLMSDFGVAIKEIVENRFLRLFIPCALVLNLLASGSGTLMLPFVLGKGFSVDEYGYLMAIETAASLICVVLLGVIKFSNRTRYCLMGMGFISSTVFYIVMFLSTNYWIICAMIFIACFMNTLGNTVFNASLVLALPEDKRGALLGFIGASCTGGCALSAIVYGLLCDIFPMPIVFTLGQVICLGPMIYLCFHKHCKEFILTN